LDAESAFRIALIAVVAPVLSPDWIAVDRTCIPCVNGSAGLLLVDDDEGRLLLMLEITEIDDKGKPHKSASGPLSTLPANPFIAIENTV